MYLQLKTRRLDLREPVVMGILNVTPDSFSDGGRHAAVAAALAHARDMIAQGAAIIDVGGESTRPGAEAVGLDEELQRTIPVIEALRLESDCVVSIDTLKPEVMRAACAAGAELVNDVNALRAPGAMDAVCDSGAAVCLMHMQGEPRTMQQQPQYEDVCAQVAAFLQQRAEACMTAGISADRIALDPGIGFGKTLEHNLDLLSAVSRLSAGQHPLLVGFSRKSMFQHLLGLPVERRLPASLAAATLAVWQGAAIVRAHDVGPTLEAIRVAAAARDRRRMRES